MKAARRRLPMGVACALAALSGAGDAGAQRAPEKVMAETLFTEGRRLMAGGRIAEACPKFAASQRLDPGLGTLLNLGDCYERVGRTASAWALFREAASLAGASGDERRAAEAWKRSAALEPRLSKLTILAPAEVPDGLEVRRGTTLVESEILGIPMPVDPGSHMIEATAPGRAVWRARAEVRGDAARVTVQIANLGPDDASRGRGQRNASLIVGGIGVAGLLVGGVLALRATSKWQDAHDSCADGSCASAAEQDKASEARTDTKVATAVLGVGALGLATGGILWLTAPARQQPSSTSLSVTPAAGPGVAGLSLRGAF